MFKIAGLCRLRGNGTEPAETGLKISVNNHLINLENVCVTMFTLMI